MMICGIPRGIKLDGHPISNKFHYQTHIHKKIAMFSFTEHHTEKAVAKKKIEKKYHIHISEENHQANLP